MKNLRLVVGIVLALFASFGISACSDDDNRLLFTEDEVIGDILTGKQVAIPRNTITTYTTRGYNINVQNADGTITAVSQNKEIATVEVVNASYEAQSIANKGLYIKGVSVGETQIIVSDESGKMATLMVKVEDINSLMTTVLTLKKTTPAVDVVEISGVDEIAENYIRKNVLSNAEKEKTFVIKSIKNPFYSLYKMEVLDKDDCVLYEMPYGQRQESVYVFFIVDELGEKQKEYMFSIGNNGGTILIEDISADYKVQYPNVKVHLIMNVQK